MTKLCYDFSFTVLVFLKKILLVSKFRLIFENHMVLKKQNVNVCQAVPFLLVADSSLCKLPFAGVVPRNRYISCICVPLLLYFKRLGAETCIEVF